MFHASGIDRKQLRFHLTYLDPRSVEAVTVIDADTVAYWIGFGAISEPKQIKNPPSRLEIQRFAEEVGKTLSAAIGSTVACEVSWDGIPSNGEPLRSLAGLMKSAQQTLTELSQDAIAKESLQKSVQKVAFGEGEPGATLQGGTLKLTATLSKSVEGRLTKQRLQSAISAVL